MSSSRNNSKTSGIRYLWIPGRKRSHPKGRFDSTNKRVTYNTGQKKIEQWSLGGSKGQRDLLKAEADGFESGPSISGLLPACAAGVPTIAVTNMPVLTENKFALLAKIDDCEQLPSPPKDGEHNGNSHNHISAADLISNSVSNHNLKKIDEDLEDDLPSPPGCDDHNSDATSECSPQRKHLSTNNNKKPNGHGRPEVDINSIESVSECKLKYSDLDIPDSVYSTTQLNNISKKKNKKKKKKNKNSLSNATSDDEDDKVVKCLYYTLMCCECTIS